MTISTDLPIWQMQIVELNGTQHTICGSKTELLAYIDQWENSKVKFDDSDDSVMKILGHTNTADRAELVLAIRLSNISSMHAVHYC